VQLAKIAADSAEQVAHLAAAGGHQLPPCDGLAPADFIGQLLESRDFEAAVKFMAFALPPREAVWWACVCARMELQEPVEGAVANALAAAETWVRKPTDEHRRAAMTCAQAANFDSPAAWAAVGAFWSGGSMGPPDVPAVPPAPHLLGVAIVGAVTLAAVQFQPELAGERRERYIAAAVNIANGGNGRVQSNEHGPSDAQGQSNGRSRGEGAR
jgi:hypothetical protein